MRLAGAGLACVAVATGVGVLYGVEDGLVTLALLIAVAATTFAVARLALARPARVGSLRRQLALSVGLALGPLMLAVVAAAALMFLSTHDAVVVCALAAATGLVGLTGASALGDAVATDIMRVRDALVALGEGRPAPEPVGPGARAGELSELAEAARMTADRLAAEAARREAAEAGRRDFLAAVSHDLRTPITTLMLLAEGMAELEVDEATRARYVAGMQTHVKALSTLVDGLLELSRLEAGAVQLRLERVPLDELVAEAVEALHLPAERAGVRIVAEVQPMLAAQTNPEALQRVLFNLIQNGVGHTPAGGTVAVRAEEHLDLVEVEVADSGAGIGADDRERVFEPYFRGGAEGVRLGQGVGLGLAISRALVEALGGEIWLAEAATGTRVRFSVPRAVA